MTEIEAIDILLNAGHFVDKENKNVALTCAYFTYEIKTASNALKSLRYTITKATFQ